MNLRNIDENTFSKNISEVGKHVTDYYTYENTDVLVEANTNCDGGKIYFAKDSWIVKGSIIQIDDEWYLVNNVSKLMSDAFNIATINRCDTFLTMKLGDWVYRIPCVASKYSVSTNAKSIIDDTVDGKLTFISGYDKKIDLYTKNPYLVKFGGNWKIFKTLHNDGLINIYTQLDNSAKLTPELGITELKSTYTVGNKVKIQANVLYTEDTEHQITYRASNTRVASVDKYTGEIEFVGNGKCNIIAECADLNIIYTSTSIMVSK